MNIMYKKYKDVLIMDSILINNKTSYNIIFPQKDDKSSKTESVQNTNYDDIDSSNISSEARIGYKFLTDIQTYIENLTKNNSTEKNSSVFDNIKNDIISGKYGNDKDKYINILNNVYKNALVDASNLLVKSGTKDINNKMTSSTLVKCQKQYENATSLVWMLRAENKRILADIEYYRKKKNHQMVTSLTNLSASYKHIINEVSNTVTLIGKNIDDNINIAPERLSL